MESLHLRTLIATALAVALVLLAGCSSTPASPTVSGSGLGDRRTVSRGDQVVIRVPAAESGASKWRLTSFDSAMLRLTQRGRFQTASNGSGEWVVRFEARTPGETEVVLTRTAASTSGEAGETRRFRIRIR